MIKMIKNILTAKVARECLKTCDVTIGMLIENIDNKQLVLDYLKDLQIQIKRALSK